MDYYTIRGGKKLNGSVPISGAKNAALPIIVASLLADGKTILTNVPDLADIRTIIKVIEYLGANSIRVSGHPEFCPNPVLASLQGSVDQDGALEQGFIGCGMRMIFLVEDVHPVTTSRVVHVRVEEPNRIQ